MEENNAHSSPATLFNSALSLAYWKAQWKAQLNWLISDVKNLGDIFERSAKPRTHTHQYGIPKGKLLPLIVHALQEKRTEPYLAVLMLAANVSEPVHESEKGKLSWDQYLTKLVEQHNAVEPTFNTKRRLLLKMLIEGGLDDYEGLRDGGFMDNHYNLKDKNHKDSIEEIMVHQNDNVPHDRRPSHINKNGTAEIQDNRIVKTYAAIPKAVMLPLLRDAMKSGSMCCAQAAMMLAINCHSMELRRTEERYLDHVMAVAANPDLNAHQRIIALMHDVIENSNYTVNDLREIGFNPAMIISLEHITKRPDENVYLHFIQRTGLDVDATAVKRADIAHNIRDAKPDKVKKYELADLYLNAVQQEVIPKGMSIETFFYYIEDIKAGVIKPDQLNVEQYTLSAYFSQALINHAEAFDSLFAPEIKNNQGQYIPAILKADTMSARPA